jgi:hypothetical protein
MLRRKSTRRLSSHAQVMVRNSLLIPIVLCHEIKWRRKDDRQGLEVASDNNMYTPLYLTSLVIQVLRISNQSLCGVMNGVALFERYEREPRIFLRVPLKSGKTEHWEILHGLRHCV